jgi:hypothetical protein
LLFQSNALLTELYDQNFLKEIGFEPIKSVLKTKILPIKLFLLFMEVRGIEPLSHACKAQILNQLNYTPFLAIAGFEPTTKPL